MDWNALISAFGYGGQAIMLLLVIYLVWSRSRDQRERRQFEQRIEEQLHRLMSWVVHRAVDAVMPEKKSDD